MSLPIFRFTKSWRSAADFPTYEHDEAKVRDDLQTLFDQCLGFLNELSQSIRASAIPFAPTPAIDSSTVQNAIENLQAQLADTAVGSLPDASVSAEKLAGGAVTGEKLADGAVAGEKLAHSAVSQDKLADGAVTEAKLAHGAVTSEKLAHGAVTAEKLSADALSAKADLVGGKLRAEQASLGTVNVSGSRALTPDDAGKLLRCTNTADAVISIPANSAAELPIGTEISLFRAGSGAVSIHAAEGVTLLSGGESKIPSVFSRVLLKKWAANTWSVEGVIPSAPVIGSAQLKTGAVRNENTDFSSGFAPAGKLLLRKNVHYCDSIAELPASGVEGQLMFVRVT